MISKIPTGALILGLSGVIPFGWGVVTLVSEEAFNFGMENFGARFAMGRGPTSDTISLIVGFMAVLLIDRHFYLLKLTPLWWMKLRIPLTFLVISLLGIGIII